MPSDEPRIHVRSLKTSKRLKPMRAVGCVKFIHLHSSHIKSNEAAGLNSSYVSFNSFSVAQLNAFFIIHFTTHRAHVHQYPLSAWLARNHAFAHAHFPTLSGSLRGHLV